MDIRLHHLSIGYRRGPVVARDINITILGGRLTCLIGDNGIGKSTLLRTLSGFQPKVGGEIWLGSRKLIVSRSASDHGLFPSFSPSGPKWVDSLSTTSSAWGAVLIRAFGATLLPAMSWPCAKVLSRRGAWPLRDRKIDSLSDGECQKVMIARALAQETPIILLDEPTAFLDFHSRIDTLRLLSRLAHTMGKTILLSTHDLQLAAELADLLLLLSPDGLRPVDPATISQDIRQRIQD